MYEESESVLKPYYKKYKNRSYTLTELGEFNKFDNPIELVSSQHLKCSENFKSTVLAYEIGNGSGFYYIPNPFNSNALLDIIVDSLTLWPSKENKMNLDIDSNRPDYVWEKSMEQMAEGAKLSESWLYKLRWTSLGYHYQWTAREYKANCQSKIPENISNLMKDIITLMDRPEFVPEAAIVNYYHLNSAMCFHQDHAEIAKNVPLVSISIGQPAVYLLGTCNSNDKPVPIALYHGDVVVMTGASRMAYHAVPKIIKMTELELINRIFEDKEVVFVDSVIERLTEVCESKKLSKDGIISSRQCAEVIWQYLQSGRINVNMRQVLPTGEKFPTDEK